MTVIDFPPSSRTEDELRTHWVIAALADVAEFCHRNNLAHIDLKLAECVEDIMVELQSDRFKARHQPGAPGQSAAALPGTISFADAARASQDRRDRRPPAAASRLDRDPRSDV